MCEFCSNSGTGLLFASPRRLQTLPGLHLVLSVAAASSQCPRSGFHMPLMQGTKGPDKGVRCLMLTLPLKISWGCLHVPLGQNPSISTRATACPSFLGSGCVRDARPWSQDLDGSPGLWWEGVQGDVRHSLPSCSQVSDVVSEKPCQG